MEEKIMNTNDVDLGEIIIQDEIKKDFSLTKNKTIIGYCLGFVSGVTATILSKRIIKKIVNRKKKEDLNSEEYLTQEDLEKMQENYCEE